MPRGPGIPPRSASSLQPTTAPATSRYNPRWPSVQSQPRIEAAHPRSRPTRHLFTTQQPCSMPQPTPPSKTSSRHKTKQGILATALRDCTVQDIMKYYICVVLKLSLNTTHSTSIHAVTYIINHLHVLAASVTFRVPYNNNDII
jgi:hypothetical protein